MEDWVYGGPDFAIAEVLPPPNSFILCFGCFTLHGKMTKKFHF